MRTLIFKWPLKIHVCLYQTTQQRVLQGKLAHSVVLIDHYVITANASTQTENVSDNAKVENSCLPIEKLDCNNFWLLKHDHPYAKSKVDHDTSSPQKPGPPLYASDEEKEEEDIDVDFDDNDSDTHFSFHDLQSSPQTDTNPETAEDSHVEEEK